MRNEGSARLTYTVQFSKYIFIKLKITYYLTYFTCVVLYGVRFDKTIKESTRICSGAPKLGIKNFIPTFRSRNDILVHFNVFFEVKTYRLYIVLLYRLF